MIGWLTASALVMAGAFALIVISFRHVRQAQDENAGRPRRQRRQEAPRLAADYLAQAGIGVAPEHIWVILVLLVVVCALCCLWLPPRYGVMAAAALLLVLHTVIRALAARLRRRALAQLPSFLNQVIRRVAAGASVELAINDSISSIGLPLRDILDRAGRRVRLGYELHDSFEREAELTGLPEFHMLATVLRLNEQFGGSIRGVLENIVDILLVQQQGQRELKALTGETRITAIVLAALPMAAAGYMLMLNPDFLLDMWKHPLGHQLLVTAMSMQALGVVVLWRMVRSV